MGKRGRKRKVSDEKARNFYLLYLSVKNKIRLDRPITEEAEIEMLELINIRAECEEIKDVITDAQKMQIMTEAQGNVQAAIPSIPKQENLERD